MVKLRRPSPDKQKADNANKKNFSRTSRILTEGLVVLSAVGLLNINTSHAQDQTKPTSTSATQSQVMLESGVVIVPDNEKGTLLNISVIVFEPAVASTDTTTKELMEQIVEGCKGAKDVHACISEKALEQAASSEGRKPEFASLKGARVIVEYYNPVTGQYMILPGCEEITTHRKGTAHMPVESGEAITSVTNYYGQCDVSGVVGGQKRTVIRVTFTPQPDQNVRSSLAMYTAEGAR